MPTPSVTAQLRALLRRPGPALVLVHNNWINIKTDADGGLDDFSSKHAGGVNLVFADGSVHFIRSITVDGPQRRAFWALAGKQVQSRVQWPGFLTRRIFLVWLIHACARTCVRVHAHGREAAIVVMRPIR